jgi:hypothetical protein
MVRVESTTNILTLAVRIRAHNLHGDSYSLDQLCSIDGLKKDLFESPAPKTVTRKSDYMDGCDATVSSPTQSEGQMKQPELYERFRLLHERKGGFIMPNAWDAVSALLLKQAGFEALGTSSAAVASALGRLDGRHAISREEHLANAQCVQRKDHVDRPHG